MTSPRADDIGTALLLAEDALDRMLASLAGVDDAWCRAPSQLPGWTRGHVLTHLARNADALRRLAVGTAVGRTVSMYGPAGAREAGIEAGAARSAAELLADVHVSGGRLHTACRQLPDTAWTLEPEWRAGRRQPLSAIPAARTVEVELHRVDLDAGYEPVDWPTPSAETVLDVALGRLAALPGAPTFEVHVEGEARPRQPADGPIVRGSSADLAAWLTGRTTGSGLRGTDPLPPVPAVWS